MPRLSIRLFGSPQIELSGRPVETDRRKAVALLAYLAVAGRAIGRDTLAALFWPEYDPSRAYAYLRRTLWELGQVLGEGWVLADRDQVRLVAQADCWVDVVRFQALATGRPGKAAGDLIAPLSEAAALYCCDFMAGFSLRDSPEFDAWQVGLSESLRRQLSETLAELSRACAELGEVDAAVSHARRWLSLDQTNEEAHRWLMELYARTGQRSAALRQYEACTRLLNDELGVGPEQATRGLYDRIRREELKPAQAVGTQVAQRPATARPQAGPVYQKPGSGTAFVGREQELAEIERLVADPDCRLLTLVGPGGIGKTRLAIQASQGQAARFASGACFVALAPVSAPDLVVSAIAAALQLKFKENSRERDSQQSPSEQLLDYLRQKELLLVLDNFEHLIPAAEVLSELLAAAPGVKALVTTRERLNLPEEWTLAVQGMSYPNQDDLTQEAFGAVRLFLQAARQTQVGFEPGEADRRAIARICRLVDGMPLGIELAASWVRVLSCPEIAAEIEHSLDFLTTSRQGVPERHRNLRAVFEHSWLLLSEYERAIFRKLSIFQGGFRREAAAQVAGASLALLTALVDKSLVRRSRDGRYDLHEVLKHYAAEKLDELPQQKSEVQEAFHHYFLGMYQDLAEALKGPDQKEALARLETELDNLRAAWLLTVEIGDLAELERGLTFLFIVHEFGMRYRLAAELIEPVLKKLRPMQAAAGQSGAYRSTLTLALALLSMYYARILERRERTLAYYKEVLQLLPGVPDGLAKACTLMAIGYGVRMLSPVECLKNYRECVRLFEQTGDRWGKATAMTVLSDVMENEQGHVEEMHGVTLEALAIYRSLGNRWSMAICYHLLATMNFWMGEYEQAMQDGLEARAIYLDYNERWRAMEAQIQLGRIETDRGRYAEARRYYLENIQFSQEMGARYFVALNQDCLGYVEILNGNLAQAELYYTRSLEIYRQLDNRHGEGMALGNLGDVAMAQKGFEQAQQYYLDSLVVLKTTPDDWARSIALKKLGHLATLTGRYPEAEAYLGEALELSQVIKRAPDIQEVRYLQALLKSKTGQPQAARKLLEEVLAHPKTTPPIHGWAQELLDTI